MVDRDLTVSSCEEAYSVRVITGEVFLEIGPR